MNPLGYLNNMRAAARLYGEEDGCDYPLNRNRDRYLLTDRRRQLRTPKPSTSTDCRFQDASQPMPIAPVRTNNKLNTFMLARASARKGATASRRIPYSRRKVKNT